MTRLGEGAAALLLMAAVGCGGDEGPTTTVMMDFAVEPSVDFYAAPFPSQHRLGPEGGVSMADFPNPDGTPIVQQVTALLDGADGFATTAGVFLRTSGPIDPTSLPSLRASVTGEASVYLLDLQTDQHIPVTVRFEADGGPHGAANLLSVLPLQGVPLQPGKAFAVVVTDAVRDAGGAPLVRGPSMNRIARGELPEGLEGDAARLYRAALESLEDAGTVDRAVGMAVFRTWDPKRRLARLIEAAKAEPTPSLEGPMRIGETFDDYCVYEGVLRGIPLYQQGEPPYVETGGDIEFDADGAPIRTGTTRARIVITIPRTDEPAEGWPLAVMIRTGGGGDRPLVDRGRRAEPGGEAVEPGTGPARQFARAGFAGISVDGPHGGLRNITNGDEQFLVFNIQNPAALRGNLWQSALEVALTRNITRPIVIDTSDCPGAAAQSSFAQEGMAVMGHSMGATIAPLVAASESPFRAFILSGAGGSWIENVVHKRSPIPTKPLAELLLGYIGIDRDLHEHDPFLSLLQWVGEPVDPPVYASQLRASGAHVLMLQGIVDTYILPPIANTTSLALGLPLGGPALDEGHPELGDFRPLREVLPFGANAEVAFPVRANDDGRTRVVVQHAEGPVEDGHEVVFQTDGPKHQYRCFLESMRTDEVATVPAPATTADAPCE